MALTSPFPPRPLPTGGVDIAGMVAKMGGAGTVNPTAEVFMQKFRRGLELVMELEKHVSANPEIGPAIQSLLEAKFGKTKTRQPKTPQDQAPTPLAPGAAQPQPPMAGMPPAAPPPPMRPAGL